MKQITFKQKEKEVDINLLTEEILKDNCVLVVTVYNGSKEVDIGRLVGEHDGYIFRNLFNAGGHSGHSPSRLLAVKHAHEMVEDSKFFIVPFPEVGKLLSFIRQHLLNS